MGNNEERGGARECAEVALDYQVGDGADTDRERAGPYRLSPRGAQVSERFVTFIKPTHGTRRISVSGTAFYEGGSRQTIAIRDVFDLCIKITEEDLPLLN